MIKALKLSALMLIFVLLPGCFTMGKSPGIEIAPPKNNILPFEGVWEVVNYINGGFPSSKKKDVESWIGKKAVFSTYGIKVGDNIWAKTGYKVKRVVAEDYFLFRYGISSIDFTASEKEVSVTTITSGDKFLYDFIRISNDEALLSIQGSIYMIKRLDKNIDQMLVRELANMKDQENETQLQTESESMSSGLLLGIRFIKNNGSITEYGYKTLWIACKDSVFHPVLETDNIFLPRKNGFWKVESDRVKVSSSEVVGKEGTHESTIGGVFKDTATKNAELREEDKLMVYNPYQLNNKSVDSGTSNLSDKSKSLNSSIIQPPNNKEQNGLFSNWKNVYRKILFIGNDYASMEVTYRDKLSNEKEGKEINIMKVQPVDNITGEHGLKISHIAGDKGLKMLRDSRNSLISGLRSSGGSMMDESIEEENFYMQRKNGHWFLKGRLNYNNNGVFGYHDFNINLIIPYTLVRYDVLALPWTDIKDRVPDAVDAFTSPNEDLAVIVSESKLYVYQINEGRLKYEPYAKIKLNKGESVIMAEWATGNYVDNWEDTFMKNDYKRVAGEE
ncbi:hypothetical protein [Pseudobacteroides cellulosolvens]|uniref:Lipoprotein n=1 Tax=Pseudobacteroides cellulosolvens ATCC 35603 = DSM 2933 TaxID=398512 RepID=A0A0L6JWD9_9FIRM|nr:hypothetical protein [Pseudobacteroides cellulosolvens]KNY30049.1 hypothetical protein Bccel_5326 [Pseudobacteroides cellulosolvens ATCC 35603 = DSM 2933]